MEKLVYMLVAVFAVSAVALAGCLWLLHSAINEGNVWKGLFALVGVLASGFYFIVSAGVFGGAR